LIRQPTREGTLERDGVSLHWLEWEPEGRAVPPALFLLHGLSSNARYWERLARRFPHRRVVALDQRAHGSSDAPDAGYAMEDLAADAAAAVAELDLGRPVVAGHSWGGTVALDLAATHPAIVAGLAVVDGPTASMAERLSWDDVQRVMQPPLPSYASLEEAYAESRRLLASAWDADLEAFVRAGLVERDGGWVLPLTAPIRLEILQNLYQFQPEAAWPAVPPPILLGLAGGDVGLRQWKEAGADRVREARPDAEIRWYDSRHDIPLIRADEVAADIERLALRAGLAEALREASALTGDWSRPATEGWTAKELLAHVSSSVAATPRVLLAPPPAAGDAAAPPFDSDRWNASMIRRRAEQTPEALVAELEAGVQELETLLRDIDLEQRVHAGPDASHSAQEALHVAVTHALDHLDEVRSALSR